MKFTKSNILPSRKCMEHKCKTCPKLETCDRTEKLEFEKLEKECEPLTYKPFENLEEILNGKNKSRN